MKEVGLLNNIIRARITSVEYGSIKKEDIEKLYVQEYGELPPNFDIIESTKLNIGEESGFNATAIHFHDKNINEVYFVNRGTEANISELKDGLFGKLKDYRKDPENLKKVVFDGNEDIYTDIYTVLVGDDQSQTVDNMKFTDKVVDKINALNSKIVPEYFLDGHSLGASEGQNIFLKKENLFTNVNLYNDAPMNIYNVILTNDGIQQLIEERYGTPVKDINDLKTIPVNNLRAILNQEFSQYSNKITYHRNTDDIMTNLTLPYEYRLIDENMSNVKTYEGNPDAEMIDLVEKYPSLTMGITYILNRANKEGGIRARDVAVLATAYSVTEDSLWSFISQIKNLTDDIDSMKGDMGEGHSMDKLIENMAKEQGRMIIDNQEIYFVADSKGDKMILLNIDETYEFYKLSTSIMLGKQSAIDNLKKVYEYQVFTRYDRFRRKVRGEMDELEQRPHAYLSSGDRYTNDAENIMLYKNLRFIDDPPRKTPINVSSHLESLIHDLQDEKVRQENFLETYKDGILKLVEADERVSLLFNTYAERRDSW